tara:strand:+ start:2522 stop:2893 length:372 start_codon:yes stop_codon:yes gene_type:complete
VNIFLLLCAAIGVLQIAENFKLISQNGEQLFLDKSFSFFEFVWLFVAIWFIFHESIETVAIVAIGTFVSYHMFRWLVGYYAYRQSEGRESNAILIPIWYFKVNLAICSIFTALSYLAYIQSSA